MGADPARIYLRPYFINLALFIKDAKTSYSIIIKETNSIKNLNKNRPRTDEKQELRRHTKKMINHLSKRRIALMSFAGSCGIISNLLWPYVDERKFLNGQGITNLDRRKKERESHLKYLFPKNCFPHLKKHFRDFLMHSDLNMDDYSLRNKHPNIAFNTNAHVLLGRNVTYWINIHPSNYIVSYYSEGKYRNVDIREMYSDILKLPPLIVNALSDIMRARIPSDYDMVRSITGER